MRRIQVANTSINVVSTNVDVRIVVGGILRASWQQLCASLNALSKHPHQKPAAKHASALAAYALAVAAYRASERLAAAAASIGETAAFLAMQPLSRFVGSLS